MMEVGFKRGEGRLAEKQEEEAEITAKGPLCEQAAAGRRRVATAPPNT